MKIARSIIQLGGRGFIYEKPVWGFQTGTPKIITDPSNNMCKYRHASGQNEYVSQSLVIAFPQTMSRKFQEADWSQELFPFIEYKSEIFSE